MSSFLQKTGDTRAGIPADQAIKRARGRPRLDPASRRKRIIEAASRLFIARGFSETSIAAISDECGLTKRSVYELVGDKEAIFHEAFANACDRLCDFPLKAPIAETPVRDVLSQMAHTALDQALAPDAVAFGRMVVVASLHFPVLVRENMNAAKSAMDKAIGDVFAELVRQDRIRKVAPATASELFYDTVVGARLLRSIQGYDEPRPTSLQVEERVDVLYAYFRLDS